MTGRRGKRTLSPEIERVHEIKAAMDKAYVRWPSEITLQCIHLLQQAGMVKDAIADELGISTRRVDQLLQSERLNSFSAEPLVPTAGAL